MFEEIDNLNIVLMIEELRPKRSDSEINDVINTYDKYHPLEIAERDSFKESSPQ